MVELLTEIEGGKEKGLKPFSQKLTELLKKEGACTLLLL